MDNTHGRKLNDIRGNAANRAAILRVVGVLNSASVGTSEYYTY
jgi:hypothetical protein